MHFSAIDSKPAKPNTNQLRGFIKPEVEPHSIFRPRKEHFMTMLPPLDDLFETICLWVRFVPSLAIRNIGGNE